MSNDTSEQLSAPDTALTEIPGSETGRGADAGGNAAPPKGSAWKRPPNGVVEPAPVIGGPSSWPALGETTRPVSRTDKPISVSDGSSQAPILSQPPQRIASNTDSNNAHGNYTAHNPPIRHKSRNRNGGVGGGGNSSGNGGPSQNTFNQPSLPMPPPFPVFRVPYGMVPAVNVMDTSVSGARQVGIGSQSNGVNEHYSPRNNNSRRGNYGSYRPRGDGQYHNNNNNNHGGRRDQDHRYVHHHPPLPQFVPPPMGYTPPLPPGAVPYMGPPPVRIFPGGFDMAPPFYYASALPPESFRAVPLVPSPPHMLYHPANENSLTSMIVKQIDFYFSDDNLVKDNYLRSNMDDQGWVPIGLIASFRRVQQLTQDISGILDSLQHSEVVEVQGDKLRRRDGWNKWLKSSARRNSEPSSTNAQSSSALENANPETAEGGILQGELTGQSGFTNRE